MADSLYDFIYVVEFSEDILKPTIDKFKEGKNIEVSFKLNVDTSNFKLCIFSNLKEAERFIEKSGNAAIIDIDAIYDDDLYLNVSLSNFSFRRIQEVVLGLKRSNFGYYDEKVACPDMEHGYKFVHDGAGDREFDFSNKGGYNQGIQYRNAQNRVYNMLSEICLEEDVYLEEIYLSFNGGRYLSDFIIDKIIDEYMTINNLHDDKSKVYCKSVSKYV